MRTAWLYVRSEPHLLTVGHYSPDGQWHSDSDHDTRESAAQRVNFLNGGSDDSLREQTKSLLATLDKLQEAVRNRKLDADAMDDAAHEARAAIAKAKGAV